MTIYAAISDDGTTLSVVEEDGWLWELGSNGSVTGGKLVEPNRIRDALVELDGFIMPGDSFKITAPMIHRIWLLVDALNELFGESVKRPTVGDICFEWTVPK